MKVRLTRERLALLQGAVFVPSGLWPVLHMRSFEAVSGRKTDKWLVRTVGLLITVVGFVLLRAGVSHRVTSEVAMTAAGASSALAAIDFAYGIPGRIPRQYLLDGLMQTTFAALWLPYLGTSNEADTAPADTDTPFVRARLG